jgi:acetate kinase
MKILTINSGSSSLKFSLYRLGRDEKLERYGQISRIGLARGLFEVKNEKNDQIQKKETEIPDHNTAIKILFDWVKKDAPEGNLAAVGHRIVHGGIKFREPILVDSEHIKELSTLIPLAPEHIPHELNAVKILHHRFPQLKQVACFDTGFHRHMSDISQMYPIPAQFWIEGIRRYGFHGLSYEYIIQELGKEKDMALSRERIVIAHLGTAPVWQPSGMAGALIRPWVLHLPEA